MRAPSRRAVVLVAVIASVMVAGIPLRPAGAAPAASGSVGEAAVVSAPVAPAALAARPVLRQGSRGAAVTTLQRRLAALHYDGGPVDGVFGSQTFHAVVAFQKINRLGRDGIVGSRTWASLDAPLVPHPRYAHSGTSVEVRLDTQVLLVFRNGAISRIVDASSGKASTPTVTGNFTVIRRINGWRTSALGRLWRPNYFFEGYAIHGYPSVPNYPASHGCVRVPMASMDRLWSVIGIGTPVHVYR